jgi:hypothetical protein
VISASDAAAADPPRLMPVFAAIAALAGLDLLGAVFARSWAEHRSQVSMLAGMVVFSALFVVYAKSLDYAELSTVTIGWVVLLQVGVLALDRMHGVAIPPNRLGAIAVILALQVYVTFSDVRS